MICRIWRGWTTPADSDTYERLLRSEIIVGIAERNIPGFRRIDVLRRDLSDGSEFTTLMWFDDLDAVRLFAGEDYEAAVVPPAARQVLARFDERSAHCRVLEQLEPGGG